MRHWAGKAVRVHHAPPISSCLQVARANTTVCWILATGEASISTMHTKTTLICCWLLLATAPALVGCSLTEEMNADTRCREFLQAPAEEQNAAVARVSDELGTRNGLTPLGRPNINYLCSRDQDRTLGEVVKATG